MYDILLYNTNINIDLIVNSIDNFFHLFLKILIISVAAKKEFVEFYLCPCTCISYLHITQAIVSEQ